MARMREWRPHGILLAVTLDRVPEVLDIARDMYLDLRLQETPGLAGSLLGGLEQHSVVPRGECVLIETFLSEPISGQSLSKASERATGRG